MRGRHCQEHDVEGASQAAGGPPAGRAHEAGCPMSETPMSDMESQLRLLMNIAAGEPPRRIRGQAVRREAVRRRMAAIMAAAAAAVVLAGGVAVAAVAQPGGPGQPPSGHTRPPVPRISASMPRYYVVGRIAPRGNETEVRATATGAVRAKVQCPWPVP